MQNDPNPFNPHTVISYHLSTESRVELTIYDLNGAVVATPIHTVQPAGEYRISFQSGYIPSGLYICRLITDNRVYTRKMIHVR